jgi:hypothetical protein
MVESQAIARVNRMGQTRNVRVVRYIMKGTVEEVRELNTKLHRGTILTITAGTATTADTEA